MMYYNLSFTTPIEEIKDVRDMRHMGMGQVIFFGEGKFDRYCAYAGVLGKDGKIWAAMPSDKYYFEIAVGLATKFGGNAVYDDVKHIFEHTGDKVDQKLIDDIYMMSMHYGVYFEWALNMFMHLYYGMIAEENKAGTKLGRSIKMHGIHSLLRKGKPVQEAADECRSIPWQDIKSACVERHIYRRE